MEPQPSAGPRRPSKLAALITPDRRDDSERVARNLELTFELFHDGVAMKRASLERAFPSASPEELDAKIAAWLLDRPHDRPGVPGKWPRR
jgi:hypothetical protein